MSGRILERYAGRPGDATAGEGAESENDGAEDFGAFGWLRGVRDRAVMLELRRKAGDILAIPYGWIERVEFDPTDGITLHAGGQRVRITGRNLNAEARAQVRLFQGITRHKVSWVQEADESASLQWPEGSTLVERIQW